MMYFNEDSNKKTWSLVQGTAQFSATHEQILNTYDRAKLQNTSKPVHTKHGNVAENSFRKWLGEFLPKRYGVTAGFVVSTGFSEQYALKHYDVILYDALSAPVLWFEEEGDSNQKVRGIPSEYVLGVIEIKATMSVASIKKAKDKLLELKILWSGANAINERYKKFLPPSFFTGIVFFDGPEKKDLKKCLNEMNVTYSELEKLFFTVVLREKFAKSRGDLDKKWARVGRIEPVVSSSALKDEKDPYLSSSVDSPNGHLAANYNMLSTFAGFAFDILAFLNGTYKQGLASSMHASGFF